LVLRAQFAVTLCQLLRPAFHPSCDHRLKPVVGVLGDQSTQRSTGLVNRLAAEDGLGGTSIRGEADRLRLFLPFRSPCPIAFLPCVGGVLEAGRGRRNVAYLR